MTGSFSTVCYREKLGFSLLSLSCEAETLGPEQSQLGDKDLEDVDDDVLDGSKVSDSPESIILKTISFCGCDNHDKHFQTNKYMLYRQIFTSIAYIILRMWYSGAV